MFAPRIVRSPSIYRVKRQFRRLSVPATVQEIEPQYPPILDLSYHAKRRRKEEMFYAMVKRQETVEEKLIAINMPRYYGWISCLLNENQVPYNTLEHAQYVTRTHIIPEAGLPSFYNNVISVEDLDETVENVRSQIKEVLLLEYSRTHRKEKSIPAEISDPEVVQDVQTKAVTRQINRILLVELSLKFPHLLEAQVDYDPRLEAFWCFGGLDPPLSIETKKNRISWMKPYAHDPIDRYFQYLGQPNIHLRHCHPLQEIVPLQESEDPNYNVPVWKFDSRTIGYHQIVRHGTNIPGFWPGDQNEFGLFSYHNCGYMATRPRHWNDEEMALKTQAVRASFAWLHSQACYQGFSTYNDITYPLVTQNIITNGQWWLFSVYQLNTMLLCDKYSDENPRRNLCWTTNPLQLFEKIENDTVHGFNDEVVKHLIKLYVNVPQKRNMNMKPFLGNDIKVVADIQDQEKRVWLEKTFKHLMSCRPRHRLMPEVYNWQQIYMQKFKTRPMEKKLEPWQKGINVMLRKLDDHTPEYIPKCKRPYPRSKEKWAKTFYPK